jgi:hypothetical protein
VNSWLLCVAICCAPPVEGEAAPKANPSSIEFIADDDPTRVVVRGRLAKPQAEQWNGKPIAEADGRRLLALRLLDEDAAAPTEGPPLFGSYEIRDGVIAFTPKFALARGARYRATAYLADPKRPESAFTWTAEYRVPEIKRRNATTVEYIAPAAERLPANMLKFGLFFSRPMREGREVFSRIHLYDAAGKEISAPWRDIELWNDDRTALTLYIHPGRIKQGVNLREEFGPVLLPNETYTLVIDADLKDTEGSPLSETVRRTFKTEPEVRGKIDVAAWKIRVPRAGTSEPLVIETDRALDLWSRNRRIEPLEILDAEGRAVAIGGNEKSPTRFVYRPSSAWPAGTYRIKVDPQLTDHAGNTPLTVFDRDLDDRSHDPSEGPVWRTFEVR